MKLLFGLVLSILAFVAIAERPSIPLNAMDWSTVSNNYDSSIFAVATAKDLLVYFDTSAVDNTVERGLPSPSGQPVMAVRRRNAEGVYVPVGNFTGFGSPSVTTNGKWVAFFGMGVALFSVDENNNTISSASFIPDFVPQGFLLSDDTFVGYEWSSPMDDGNYTIKSYQYESSNNTWNAIAGTEVVINYQLEFEQSGNTPYQVTDTHLVIVDPINSDSFAVNIFERQANKSWNFIESVPVNNNTAYVYYNGVDTIACVAPISVDDQSTGVLFVYTKMNGKWIEQMYDTISIGFRPVGYFGQVVLFVDANTLLVSAPFDGVEESNVDSLPTSGRIVVMTRNSTGLWEPSADLIGPGLFGLGIGVNDFDIVVPSISPFMNTGQLSVNFQTLPRCFNQPINVTCADEQANECSDIEISSLYTINNAQCGAVETTFGQLGLANNAIRAHLSFSRAGASVSCNVTVTCPSAPTFVQQQTPTGKVSNAGTLGLGIVVLVSVLMFV